jgi:hypothetical protein
MTQGPTLMPPRADLKDPLAVIAVSAAPIVLEGRYRLLVGALVRLRRSRRGRWAFAAGYGAVAIALLLLTARHFATTSWPLSRGDPGVLVAAALLLLAAQALKAFGWARLFRLEERPTALALAAGNGGAALAGVVLPGRFDDATRIAVVRRYPRCPAGVRALALSLVMLGLIDSAALAPLAFVGACLSRCWSRSAYRPRRGGSRRSRSRGRDRRPAGPSREPTRAALSTRSLVEPANDVVAARSRSLGVRVCLLARSRDSGLPAPGDARNRLLDPACAPLSLCQCSSRSAADRPGRRGHTGRRWRRSLDRLGCGRIGSTCCRPLRRGARSSHRDGRHPLRGHVDDGYLAEASNSGRSDGRSPLISTIRRERVCPSLRRRSTPADTVNRKSANKNEDAEAETPQPGPDDDIRSHRHDPFLVQGHWRRFSRGVVRSLRTGRRRRSRPRLWLALTGARRAVTSFSTTGR